MTEHGQSTLGADLGLFTEFATRLGRGLAARVEGEVETAAGEAIPLDRESVGEQAPAGALVARTVWSHDGEPRSGCFVWSGEIGALLGGADRPVAELSEEEIRTLDQSLRLNVEEGGEGDFALEWGELEPASGTAVAATLRECGIAERTEAVRMALRIAGRELTFLFFESASTPAASAEAVVERGTAAAAPAAEAEVVAEPRATVEAGEDDGADRPDHLKKLLGLRMPLSIRLGSTRMSLDEVLRLAPGSIVELDDREDEPLEVLANGTVIARGEVVVVDERFGLRITEVGTPEERLDAAR